MVARMTGTASDFGKELDSLADVVTFGVAPAVLAYLWGFRSLWPSTDPVDQHKLVGLGLVVCFLFLICGACRLARFNISVNPQPRNPGRPGKKVFRRHAHPRRRGGDRVGRAVSAGSPDP